MAFAITKYIYPLKEELILSTHLHFVFDNPRTPEEIQLVKEYINTTLQEDNSDEKSPIAPLLKRAAFSIYRLKEKLKEIDKDGYVLKYYNDNYEKKIADILSETWIIVRMKEENEFKELLKSRTHLFSTIFSKTDTIYTTQFAELSHYCHLISLLGNNDANYHGESFLLSKDPYEVFFSSINENVYEAVEDFTEYNNMMQHKNRYNNWLYWIDGFENILQEANRIDSLIVQEAAVKEEKKPIRISQKQTPKQKLLHIGRLLKTSYEHSKDPELMLLLQVSIIEYLITRNPDTTKFNVEDSISKQFKLKCAVLIHSRDKGYDLVKLNNELTKIYDQRSDLAHGNYKEVFKTDEIIKSLLLLYKFNTHLLNVFIEDRNLIEYLKDN